MTEPEFITSIHEMAQAAHVNDPGADFADWLDAYQQCAQILGFSPAAENLPEHEADHIHHLVLTWGEDADYDVGMRFFSECGCSLCATALANWERGHQ